MYIFSSLPSKSIKSCEIKTEIQLSLDHLLGVDWLVVWVL